MQHGDLGSKVLWVLRNARAHAADPAVRAASGFATGAGRARAVHRSQVGRWEGGAVAVTHDLVRRYERVLDLPEGQLLAAIDVFSRTMLVPPSVPVPLPPPGEPDPDETLELLERVLGTERMTGVDWDRLSRNLTRLPHVLLRARDWEAILRRCNQEIGLSLELDFVLRYYAAVRFVSHPKSAVLAADLAADGLRDPTRQVYVDTASVLRYTSHQAAIDVLIDQLRNPTNDHALRSALMVLTSLVQRRTLHRKSVIEATRLSVEHLRDPQRSFLARRGAASFIHAVNLPSRESLAAGLTVDNQEFAASIVLAGRARRPDDLRDLRFRIRRRLAQSLSPADLEEPVLDSVIGAAIGESNEETSGSALAVLMLSPQGPVVGRAYVDELVQSLIGGDLVAAHECLAVLSWLMRPESLDVLTDLASDPEVDAEIAYEAFNAVGNAGEPAGPTQRARDELLHDGLVTVVRETTKPPPRSEGLIRGHAYALGMRGRYDLLSAVLDDLDSGRLQAASPVVEAQARALLGWWRDVPDHVRPLR
ncbi:MAG: hypothetical protein L0H79_17340 [Intrasporangium sp.]|uniref:hypothetical protein n=1 Tax=Intrasporangium sp. TaxID=1925024 RepID=UPI002647A643|nr:hypothetical protein [Intrasporangium sp.]MDN5797496.1 hypothetical protein [Intrasporangium sp.]